MKKFLVLFAALIATIGLVSAAGNGKPVWTGKNPAYPYQSTYNNYEIFCHEPQSDNVTFCKVYEYVEVGENVYELEFYTNAHIWLSGYDDPPMGPDDWEWTGLIWIRFTPEEDIL